MNAITAFLKPALSEFYIMIVRSGNTWSAIGEDLMSREEAAQAYADWASSYDAASVLRIDPTKGTSEDVTHLIERDCRDYGSDNTGQYREAVIAGHFA